MTQPSLLMTQPRLIPSEISLKKICKLSKIPSETCLKLVKLVKLVKPFIIENPRRLWQLP